MYYTFAPFYFESEKEFYALPVNEQVDAIADSYADLLWDAAAKIGISVKEAKSYGVHPCDDMGQWRTFLDEEWATYESIYQDQLNWRP